MSKYSNTIEYNIRTTLDNSGIAKLQSELTQLQNKINTMGARGFMSESGVNKTLADIKKVQTALTNAFNPKLGMLNTSKFMSEIKGMGMSMNSIYQSFSQAGAAGTRAFTSMYGQISKIDTGLKSVSKTTDKIINTFGNTFRWGLIASAFAGIMNSVHQAGQYVQELDKSLTNIMMVSGESRENMNEFAKSANDAAIRLGATTTQMTNAAKVFVQQGMSLEQSQQMGEYAVHLANISEQDSATTADELTAMKNAFKIDIDDMGNAISKWAIIANKTAVDMKELSVASQKAASVANTTGVSMEQFAGHIAAIEATTREAPENIGNGLKTLYSRFADVKLGEKLEDGVDLGQFASALNKVGVDILDTSGKMKDVGVILEDTMKVWGQLDKTQQNALATTVAGRFQLGRFEALMNSQDIYQTAVGAARNETGTETYDQMQEKYRDSLEGRMKALGASVEKVFLNIFESSSFNGAVDALTGLVDTLNELIEATGGGSNALLGLSAILVNLASNNISRGISNMITNVQANRAGQANIAEQEKLARAQLAGQGLNTGDKRVDAFATDMAKIGQYAGSLNEEQQQNYNNLIRDRVQILNDLSTATEKQTKAEQILRVALQENATTGKMSTDRLVALAEKVNANSEIDLLKEPEFRKASSEIKILTEDFTKFKKALDEGKTSPIALAESAENLSKSLIKLKESGIFTEEQLTKVNVVLKQLEPAINGEAEAVSKLSEAFLTEMSEALTIDIDQLKQLLQVLGQARGEVAAMGAAEEVAAGQMQHMAHSVELQNTTNQIVGLVSGLGQLAFAIQSIKSLGSIWTNEDLTFGEKFLDTVVNISFVLPMLMTGFQQLKTGFGAASSQLRLLTQSLATYQNRAGQTVSYISAETQARRQNSLALTQETVARNVNNLAQQGEVGKLKLIAIAKRMGIKDAAQMSTAELQEAMSRKANVEALNEENIGLSRSQILKKGLGGFFKSIGPTLAITAAFAAVSAGISYIEEQQRKYAEETQKNIDRFQERQQKISQYNEYKDLYENYKKTGKASEEFSNKTVELADSLGIANAKILEETGHLNLLNEEIEKAISKEKELAEIEKKRGLEGLKSEVTGEFQSVREAMRSVGHAQKANAYEGLFSPEQLIGISADELQYVQNELEKFNEQKNQLLKDNPDADTTWIDEQIKSLENAQEKINSFINSEPAQETKEIFKASAENILSTLTEKDLKGTTPQEILDNLIGDNQEFKDYLTLIGKEDGEAFKESLLAAAESLTTDEKLKEQIHKTLEEYEPKISVEDLQKSAIGGKGNLDFGDEAEDIIHRSQKDEQDLTGSVSESLGVKEEELTKLVDDYSLAIERNSEALSKRKEEIDSSISSNTEWLESIEEKRKAELSELKNEKDIATAISKAKDINEKWDKEISNTSDSLRAANKNSEEYKKTLRGIASVQISVEQGTKKLVENFSDWDEVLSDDNALMSDITSTSLEVADALSMITGLDASTFDATFIKDNLDLIRDAATGDVDKLRELQLVCAEKFLIDIGFTDGAGQLPSRINDLMAQIQQIAANADVGVDVTADVQPLINEFIRMALQAGMSVEDVQRAIESLNGIGITANITTNVQDIIADVPKIAMDAFEGAGGGIAGVGAAVSTVTEKVGEVLFPEATYTVNGAGSNQTLGNAASAGGSGGSGGGGGGGGDGGGGGSENEPKHVDATESAKSEDDIYNKVDKTLDKLADDYTKVSKAKDRMHGDKYRKAAEKELENLAQQNATLKERIDISEKYAQALRTGQDNAQYGIYLEGESLGKYGLSDSNMDGVIDNYISAYNKAKAAEVAAQKAADDYYNSLGGNMTEDQQNHYEELTKQQKEAADHATKLTEIANKYQETMDKIRDDTEQVNENLYEMEDIQIDLFKTAVDTVDAYKKMREQATWLRGFYSGDKKDSPFRKMGEDVGNLHSLLESTRESGRKFFDDMIAGAKDAETASFWKLVRDKSATKFGDGTSILDMRQFYLETLLSNEGKAIFGSNTKEYQDLLDELYDAVLQDLEDIEDRYNDLLEDILDAYDEINDAMDNRNKQIDYQNKALEHQRSLIELIHGDEAYGMFGLVNDAQITATLLKVDEARRDYDYWVAQRDKFDKKTQKELWDAMNERVLEYGENLQEATEESAQVMVQQYMDATDKIIQDFRNKMFGGSLDDAEFFDKEWEMANDQAEQYLDTVESAYERDKLRLRYQKMLDQSNDLLTQNKIKQAMKEQLAALENQKKAIINNQGELEYVNALSQFDVDLANAKVEALQKQIALEEAQRNKNQMELRRDTQGNYRYVYTANEDDLLNAQEELANSEYEIYEMSKQRYGDILNERWALQQEYEDKIRWARERYKDDTAKLNEALNEINEWYTERQVNLGLELQDAQAGMIEGVEHLAETTSDYVSQLFEDISQDMQDNWGECMENIGVAYSATLADLTEDTAAFREEVNDIHAEIVESANDFSLNLTKLEAKSRTSFNNIKNNIAPINSEMEKLNQYTDEFLSMISADTGRIDEGARQLEAYRKEIESLKNSSSALANTLRQTQAARDAALGEAQNYKTKYTNAQNKLTGIANGTLDKNGNAVQQASGGNTGGYDMSTLVEGIAGNIWIWGGWGNNPTRRAEMHTRFGDDKGEEVYHNVQSKFNSGYGYSYDPPNSWDYYKSFYPSNFDTGGYTGVWGVDGRMAVLHEKELVLNATDTENMLAAVSIVRTLVDNLKSLGLTGSISSLGKPNSSNGETVEQRVEITAEFPNVDDSNDIRNALLGLADSAYQYAYKSKGKNM